MLSRYLRVSLASFAIGINLGMSQYIYLLIESKIEDFFNSILSLGIISIWFRAIQQAKFYWLHFMKLPFISPIYPYSKQKLRLLS